MILDRYLAGPLTAAVGPLKKGMCGPLPPLVRAKMGP